MQNPQSEYTADITPDEHQMIRACVLMSARMAQEKETEARATEVVGALANALSNMNHGRMSTADVEVICASLEAMCRLMKKDRNLPGSQRRAAIFQAAQIQQKLQRGAHG